MKLHATHCKFCKRPITLEVDEEYSLDPILDGLVSKLLGLACCNHCADVRVDRRTVESKLGWICPRIAVMPVKDRDRLRGALTKLSQDYARIVARWHHKEGMSWDEAIVDAIIDNPTEWPRIIGRLWKMFRQSQEMFPNFVQP